MFSSFTTVNIDTEFRAPCDCPRSGDVNCRVARAECDVIATWDHWVTLKVRLLLRIRVRHHRGPDCIFFKEVVIKETVSLDCHLWITVCEVVATACKCVINRGKVHCDLTVKVEFFLKNKVCHHWKDDWDWHDDWDGKHGYFGPKQEPFLFKVVQALPRMILPC